MNVLTMKNSDPETRLINRLFFNSFYVFVLSTLTAALGSIIDGIIIGNTMNTTAVAAFGLINPLNVAFAIFSGILSSGAQNACTRRIAQGNVKKAREVFSMTFYIGLILSVIVLIAVILHSRQIILWVTDEEPELELLRASRAYLVGHVLGLPAITGMRMLIPFMSLDSDRMRAFYAVVSMSVVNLVGDFLVVSVFHGGLTGIALITSLSNYIGFAVLMGHFRRQNILLRLTRTDLNWKDLVQVVVRGFPKGIYEAATVVHNICLNIALVLLSTASLAGLSARITMSYFTDAVVIGVAQAILVQGAMFYGEENRAALGKLIRTAVRYEILLVPAMSLICYLLAPQIARIYLGMNYEAYAYGISSIQWYTAALLFQGINLLYAYYLQATGNLVRANMIYIMEWLVFPAAVILGFRCSAASEVFRGIALSHVLMFGTLILHLMIRNRTVKLTLNDILVLPEDFGVGREDEVTVEIDSAKITEENAAKTVVAASERVRNFARRKGIDEKRAYAASLAVEEMTANIIAHGFPETEGANVMTVRAFTKHDELILLIRDDCDPFDPMQRMKTMDTDDPTANIGLRLTIGMAKDVSYTSAQHLNNLIIRI